MNAAQAAGSFYPPVCGPASCPPVVKGKENWGTPDVVDRPKGCPVPGPAPWTPVVVAAVLVVVAVVADVAVVAAVVATVVVLSKPAPWPASGPAG